MRKIQLLGTIAAMAMILTSCGASKKTASSPSGDQLLPEEPCIVYAMEKPAKRAYGTGVHFKEATARNIAEAQARAALARALNTKIEAATEEYANNYELFSTDGVESAAVSDQGSTMNDKVFSITQEAISSAVVVKTTRYATQDRQFRYYVCVEYNEDVSTLAKKVASKFEQKLSDEEKKQLEFDQFRFEEKIKEQLENYLR